MKVYLAARYGRRLEMVGVARELRVAGHVVTSRWINGSHEMHDKTENPDNDLDRTQFGRMFAEDDIEDIEKAEALIAFTEAPEGGVGRGRGGRHVELGYMLCIVRNLAPSRKIIVIGWRENVFCCMSQVVHYPDMEAFRQSWLRQSVTFN
jgi:hypothetical protein